MKKLLIIASVIAVSLTGCNNNGDNSPATEVASDSVSHREVSDKIAYIRIDTLMSHYEMSLDLTAELEAKAKQINNDVKSRQTSLERAVADANARAERGALTRTDQAELAEKLQRQEADFYQYAESKQMELDEERITMTNKLFYNLEEYVKEFNSDYRYSMIITTSAGAPILSADPQLDITMEVLKGMNERYAREKSADSK